jgi:hypothetical protein
MTEADFHRPEAGKLHSVLRPSLSICRGRINAVGRGSVFGDSLYLLVAALSLAALIGWLSFVTIAART